MTDISGDRRERDVTSKVTHPAIPGVASESTIVDKGRQITVSTGHRRSSNGKYYEGGPFYTAKCWAERGTRKVHIPQDRFGNKSKAIDAIMTIGSSAPPLNVTKASNPFRSADLADLNDDGATAISLCAPTNSVASAAVAYGEILKDKRLPIPGIPTWQQRTKIAKAAGSEFLNAVFGWLPLVADVTQVAQAASNSAAILKAYQQNEGTDVHRTFYFDPEHTSSETIIGSGTAQIGGATGLYTDLSQGVGVISRKVETSRRKWFSGAFTYGLPSSSTTWKKALGFGSEADYLLGTTLTPNVLWELAPWSWAADWFSNAGHVVNNLTQFGVNGLVMRYGYIMEEFTSTTTYSLSQACLQGMPKAAVPDTVIHTVTKCRAEANPFGFGLSWQGLSPMQLAISAALGITRMR